MRRLHLGAPWNAWELVHEIPVGHDSLDLLSKLREVRGRVEKKLPSSFRAHPGEPGRRPPRVVVHSDVEEVIAPRPRCFRRISVLLPNTRCRPLGGSARSSSPRGAGVLPAATVRSGSWSGRCRRSSSSPGFGALRRLWRKDDRASGRGDENRRPCYGELVGRVCGRRCRSEERSSRPAGGPLP
jgi:hypothetical protein